MKGMPSGLFLDYSHRRKEQRRLPEFRNSQTAQNPTVTALLGKALLTLTSRTRWPETTVNCFPLFLLLRENYMELPCGCPVFPVF